MERMLLGSAGLAPEKLLKYVAVLQLLLPLGIKGVSNNSVGLRSKEGGPEYGPEDSKINANDDLEDFVGKERCSVGGGDNLPY